jgi:hypothetical protein
MQFLHPWMLNKAFSGHTFMSDNSVQKSVVQEFRQQPKELFTDGIC